jgi:hypothetical protein
MKKTVWVVMLAALALVAWRGLRGGSVADDERRGADLFYGRAWIDHRPATPNDTFHVFGTADSERFGWLAERTRWKGAWEIFKYQERGDGKVEIVRPETGERLRVSYRAWRCEERGFDYCLEMSGMPGPSRFYSKKGWERRRLDVNALFVD